MVKFPYLKFRDDTDVLHALVVRVIALEQRVAVLEGQPQSLDDLQDVIHRELLRLGVLPDIR